MITEENIETNFFKNKSSNTNHENKKIQSPSNVVSTSPTNTELLAKKLKNPFQLERHDFDLYTQRLKWNFDYDIEELENSTIWEEPKRFVGFPYTNFHHKTVDDLIKEKVTEANRKMKEEIDRNEGSSYCYPSVSSIPSPTMSPTKFKKDQDINEDNNYFSNDLTELLKDRLSKASQEVTNAKEVTMNSQLWKSKSPFGFEDIKEDEKGPFFNEIIEFLNPFLSELIDQKIEKKGGLDTVTQRLQHHFKKYSKEKERLLAIMNVKRIVVPVISLDLPGDIILTYNKMEENDPLVAVFRLHPVIGEEVYKFGIFLDRYDTNKEVICSLVWSTIDNMVICLPMVGLNPYPVCWSCERDFGTMTCAKCEVAKYCSKECQIASWKASHKSKCEEISYYTQQHKHLVFE